MAIGFEPEKCGRCWTRTGYRSPGAGPGRHWSTRTRGRRRGVPRLAAGYLRADAARARLGNAAGPLKAALDVLRDLRNELRQIVDHGGLSGTPPGAPGPLVHPLNAFLSIGPPRRRIEEMAALMEAGVLDVLGPGLRVTCGADGTAGFGAHSAQAPGPRVVATTLIEARLPEPDLRRTADALLADLLRTGQCRTHRVGAYETGGLDVTESPYRIVDRGAGRIRAGSR
ncbi:hypothetical protein NKH77_16110 [Streptomyces sp. M19]